MEITLGHKIKVQTFVHFVFKDDQNSIVELKPSMQDKGAITWFYGRDGQEHILVVGLGKREEFQGEVLRQAAGNAGRAVKKEQIKSLEVNFEPLRKVLSPAKACSEDNVVTAWVEGFLLGCYAFDKFKSEKEPMTIEHMQILPLRVDGFEEAIRQGEIRAKAVALTRDLVNEPANYLNPKSFVDRVRSHFADRPVKVHVYKGDELKREKMEGLLAVGRGSQNPPAMVEIRYATDRELPLIALVGKGITFDMGGMNVKTGRDISDMRCDMGGAAAVVGALDIITAMGLKANVVALMPLAENLPDGGAYLPSHVIEYPNGLSVQVGNTDAEGRLILADALILAQRLGAEEIIDIATLTGNIVVALGQNLAGVFGDEDLVQQLVPLANNSGDKLWPMPLIDEYEEFIKSNYADLNNTSSSSYGGSITAALFLRRFIDQGARWAHIDMAGTMDVKAAKGYHSAGATGFGARLLADYVGSKYH